MRALIINELVEEEGNCFISFLFRDNKNRYQKENFFAFFFFFFLLGLAKCRERYEVGSRHSFNPMKHLLIYSNI